MTVDEFNTLCEAEWGNGRGDVHTLWLVRESLMKLTESVLVEETLVVDTGEGGTVGAALRTLTNPATKNLVYIRPASDRDVADVSYGGGRGETRFL